ncbi:MAG: glycosyltransferase family 4 protein [Pseudomonadota bacterium]
MPDDAQAPPGIIGRPGAEAADLAALVRPLRDSGRDILVVSDKYPPHSVGGAEISLHLCCSRPELAGRVVVAVFSPAQARPGLYWHDGVAVVTLPDADPWPVHSRPFGTHRAISSRGGWARVRYELYQGAGFLFAGGRPWHIADRAAALCFELWGKPRGGIASDFGLGARWYRMRAIQALIGALAPHRVLLDNYRSILLGSGIRRRWPGIEITAVVRDNRFSCARYDQSRQIGGANCPRCRFQCATVDAPRQRFWHRRHLGLSARARQRALAAADRVVVTSGYLRREVGALTGAAPIVRIPNPGGHLGQTAGFIRGVPEAPGENLLIIGMLNENKGQLAFLRAAADWLCANPRRHVHLAGRGERIAGQIRAFAEREGLSRQITLHGYLGREALFRLMRRCQVVVAPAVWPEPFGRVPLEAGLARRPVVAFACGGLAESIDDGKTGFLAPPADYSTLIERIGRLMGDAALRHDMGMRAYAHISQRYDLDRVARAFLDLFELPAADRLEGTARAGSDRLPRA